ncbi:MAG TPA: SAM-dependent methyltransferase, partial [Stackebrandtia sp.]|uniref:class I SAM-dependent methyltransferase n=1 Tax=Stackebrandtia sp. TaxID=2023065 RepID=UPI002D483A7A
VTNVDFDACGAELDAILAEPYGNWRVETVYSTLQLRITKRGKAQVHREGTARAQDLAHDRTAPHLIAPDDPLFGALGAGAAKRRQVDAFLRAARPLLGDAAGVRHVADLGCGNAYLTFAMYRYLAMSGADVRVTGVDVRPDQRERNTALAKQLGWEDRVRFVAGTIDEAPLDEVDVVLALHACDTATDDALARGVALGAKHILAAPCCHHDIAAQLRGSQAPAPYGGLVADGILRERFADVLTDTLRAMLLRLNGYRVDVIEFIDSAHTPRNTLLRATRTGASPDEAARREYRDLVEQWKIRPRLEELLTSPRR